MPKLTALRKDLDHYLSHYNSDRAHPGRLTRGRVPAEIVYGAAKMGARPSCRDNSGLAHTNPLGRRGARSEPDRRGNYRLAT